MDIIGIDISKGWFDCYCSRRRAHKRFDNTPAGWKQFAGWVKGKKVHVVMEASGPYYLGLASYLHAQGMPVSVVNPLVIRRYGQMKLARVKTDPKDAELIAGYGASQTPPLWHPPSQVCRALRQLMSVREGLLRQQSIGKGQAEAFGQAPADPLVMQLLGEQRERVRQAIARIDRRLEELARLHYLNRLQALLSIPGVGPKTAIMLLAITDGFTRFESARALASYVGICPRIWQSGRSINGGGSISKLGCAPLRKLLYMCSWTAKRCNPACRQMHERLAAKGKPEKVINVAIAHKLLRQAFAVGKNQEHFNAKKAMAA